MSGMSDMTSTSFAAAVAPCTGKIIKMASVRVFERGENFLQNGILQKWYFGT